MSQARRSPTGRRVTGTDQRIAHIERYEKWKSPTKVRFEEIVGVGQWEAYWSTCESIIGELREAQDVADVLRGRIADALEAEMT